MELDVRWKQRFHNFNRAFALLREALQERTLDRMSMLEKEGTIQRFEYAYELAWKTLKDYLEYNGSLNLGDDGTARNVFKAAFAANIITDKDVYVDMMLSRNLLSHCYDFDKFTVILLKVQDSYFAALDDLHSYFLGKVSEPND